MEGRKAAVQETNLRGQSLACKRASEMLIVKEIFLKRREGGS